MKWRIYRLPGSKEWWLIDSGSNTECFAVRKYKAALPTESVEIGGEHSPRAWIEVTGTLYISHGYQEALFL